MRREIRRIRLVPYLGNTLQDGFALMLVAFVETETFSDGQWTRG